MFFVSLQKLFSFSRKSYFRILAIQISWRYQMPNHKTRNTFCWITWEVNTVFQWNLASLCHITKENNLLENSAKIAAWKLVPALLQFLKQALYIRYVTAELSKFIQISLQTSSDSFLQKFLWKLIRAWN